MFDDLDGWIRAEFARDRSPSMSIAVGTGDDVVHARAYGLADVATGRPATTETPYLLASVTKPLTATCVCLLATGGSIELDEPIDRYLGGVVPPPVIAGWRPSVRHVLQHRGGFGRFWRFFYTDELDEVPAFAETAARYGHVFSPPGERYVYSNLGFGLLGEVVASVTGRPLAEVMRTELFTRVGMPSGWLGASYGGAIEPAIRYSASGWPYPDYDTESRGSSLAWSTAADLVRFGLAHVSDGSPFPSEVTGPMTDAPTDAMTEELDFRYGLGWTLKDVDGLRVVSHAGMMGGVTTILALIPARRAAIAVLANSTGSGLPWIVGRRLIGAVLGPSAPDLQRVWDEGPAQPERVLPEVAERLAGRWIGEFSTPDGEVPIAIELREDGMALASLDGGPSVRATVSRDPSFGVELEVPLRLPTTDARVRTDLIACSLAMLDDTLRGTANAEARLAEDPDRVRRYGSSLPHPCELRRA